MTALGCLAWSVTMPGTDGYADDAHRFVTGKQRVSLVELYTSEGCSSCPPADRWLSRLKADPRLWKQIVPVAFHVGYWDYIGWKDRFAQPAYGDRQRAYERAGRAKTVYTPGFFTNGEEWTGFFAGQPLPAYPEPVGVLELYVDGDRATARFAPRFEGHGELTLHVALLGMDRVSDVNAGENRGRTLKHDFVVLDLRSRPMSKADGGFGVEARLPRLDAAGPPLAIAAWITEAGDLTPIQAVGGPL